MEGLFRETWWVPALHFSELLGGNDLIRKAKGLTSAFSFVVFRLVEQNLKEEEDGNASTSRKILDATLGG